MQLCRSGGHANPFIKFLAYRKGDDWDGPHMTLWGPDKTRIEGEEKSYDYDEDRKYDSDVDSDLGADEAGWIDHSKTFAWYILIF